MCLRKQRAKWISERCTVLGDAEKPSGHSPEQLALKGLASARGMDQVTSTGSFQTQPFSEPFRKQKQKPTNQQKTTEVLTLRSCPIAQHAMADSSTVFKISFDKSSFLFVLLIVLFLFFCLLLVSVEQ